MSGPRFEQVYDRVWRLPAAIRDRFGLEDDASTGLPFFAVPTLPAYLRASR